MITCRHDWIIIREPGELVRCTRCASSLGGAAALELIRRGIAR